MKYKALTVVLLISIFYFVFFKFSNLKANPVGQIVYDPKGLVEMQKQVEQLQKQLDYLEKQQKLLGEGSLSPSLINKIGNLYEKCGGKKVGLPDFFPRAKVDFCAEDSKLIDIQIQWMKENYLPLSTDTTDQKIRKAEKLAQDNIKVQALILSRAVTDLEQREAKNEKIDVLQNSINSTNTMMEIQQIQLQIQLEILKELQEMNTTNSHILNYLGRVK